MPFKVIVEYSIEYNNIIPSLNVIGFVVSLKMKYKTEKQQRGFKDDTDRFFD
jgi:hypothetical protein